MRFDRLTLKAQEAVGEAQNIAGKLNQQEIAPEHLLLALMRQEGGVVPAILKKIGANISKMEGDLESAIRALPQVTGAGVGQVYISSTLNRIFDAAFKEAEALKDEFVSTEHLLISIADAKQTKAGLPAGALVAGDMLREQGASKSVILKILKDIRGTQRVTDQDPEGKYQALKKYARDLTELARKGSLDPVIGRDDEIRRVIHVLSRRTKNNPVLIGDPGVGKTAIVEGLAQRIDSYSWDLPAAERRRRLVRLRNSYLTTKRRWCAST